MCFWINYAVEEVVGAKAILFQNSGREGGICSIQSHLGCVALLRTVMAPPFSQKVTIAIQRMSGN